MSEIDLSDFSNLDPGQFAQMVKSASKDQLEAVMASDQRPKILNEIFGRFPAQFRADNAGGAQG